MKNSYKLKKFVPVSLLLIFILFIFPYTAALAQEADKIVSGAEAERIETLMEQRGEFILNEKDTTSIDAMLRLLGVEFLSDAEVNEEFGVTVQDIPAPTTRVTKPTNGKVTWTSYRSIITYAGKKYDVQYLEAAPTSRVSPLRTSGDVAQKWSGSFAAAGLQFVKAGLGTIPGKTGFAFSAFDALRSAAGDLKTTTIIENLQAVYSWQNLTWASFVYVKPYGSSDSNQAIGHISTRTETQVGWTIKNWSYKGGKATNNMTQGTKSFASKPPRYKDGAAACKGFVENRTIRDCIGSISVQGTNKKKLTTIYPVSPQFPAHVI